jgi:hypothetical protein
MACYNPALSYVRTILGSVTNIILGFFLPLKLLFSFSKFSEFFFFFGASKYPSCKEGVALYS